MLASLMNRRKLHPVDIGGRFSKRETPWVIWEVRSTYRGIDGYPYAAMTCLSDPTQHKTISLQVLEDGEQYARVG
jgi:hypothetical protein